MSVYSRSIADGARVIFPFDSTYIANEGTITASTLPTLVGPAPTFNSQSPSGGNGSWTSSSLNYLQNTAIDVIPYSTGNFAIEFVFKTTATSGSLGGILGSAYTSINASGGLDFYVANQSYSKTVTSTIAINDGLWHHVVVRRLDTTHTIWIDGVKNKDESAFFGSFNNDTGFYAGNIIGTMDFAAEYNTLSDTKITEHASDFITARDILSNVSYTAEAMNASALAVQPAITTIRNPNNTAAVMTASATSPNAIQSARDNFTLLDTYMSTLTLEQFYKFDEPKTITNYGSGDNIAFIYTGTAKNDTTSGVQNHGALRVTGSTNDSVYSLGANAANPFLDGNFSLGFWVKKSTAQAATIFAAHETTENVAVYFDADGKIVVNAFLNNQNHDIYTSTSKTDGNWHYVAVRKSGSTMQMWVDGTSIGTVTVNHSMAAFNVIDFGSGGGSNTELMYVSHFYIATATNVTSTQIANIWSYGQATVQGGAAMPMPKFSRDNALNNYIQGKSPVFYFKMDQSTGLPLNYGSASISLSQLNSSFTQNITSPNYKAYNFTNRDTQFTGAWSATAGTFSSANQQTIMVYAKFNSGNASGLFSTASFGGTTGAGLLIQQLANGTVRLRIQDDNYNDFVTTSTSYADGNYHMIVGTKDGSNLKLYIDGVEIVTSAASSSTLTDAGQLAIGGLPGLIPASGSRDVTLDELAVFNSAFTAQEAFDIYQKIALVQDTTATALMVQPAITVGFGPIINPGVSTATALLPDPTQLDTIAPTIAVMTVTAMFQMPNFAATKNTNNAAAVMTASAQGEDPAVAGNGIVGALHMNAVASFPEGKVRIPGVWNADPFTTSAEMVQPGLATTLGALIKPQSLNASAQLPLPPAYYTITDDKWYQRLLDVDYQSSAYNGIITFFNTSTNIYRSGSYGGWTAHNISNAFNSNYGYNLYDTPLPVATAGYFDTQNRKALNIRNIALVQGDNETYFGGWTMELMIQTTKKNQFIAAGTYLGNPASSVSRSYRTGIRLKDGKIAITDVKDVSVGRLGSNDSLAITGFKDIADGEWHHIIIQYRPDGVDQYAPRTQIFIDGKLDIQNYGSRVYFPGQIGYNSNDVNAYSDFNISAIATNKGSFVLEREITINYLAAFGITPVEAEPATASATLTANNKGRGNRGRALMLYFWPTFKFDDPRYVPYQRFMGGEAGLGFTNADQGAYGDDPDTFYPVATQLGQGANKFYDWDIWPVPVINYPDNDQFVGDSHPVLKDGIAAYGTTLGTVYVNPVTGNERYLNLMTDLKDLSQFDMICFRNYPDQSGERDTFGTGAKGVADPYFNILDKALFEEFLASLRDAVDSGISLLITNPQLAVDMGFIDTYHQIDSLNGYGNAEGSDPFVPIKLNDPLGTGSPVLSIYYDTSITSDNRTNAYQDYYRNNYHQVVNTIPGLTDDPAYIWKDEVYYKADGLIYGELDRIWSRIEYNPGLQLGDKFLISSMIGAGTYHAVPIDAVKAGKVITKFADTYMHGEIERVNPYRNYATTIAVEPGTVVSGKQIGAKVFISFTDNPGRQKGAGSVYNNPGYGYPIENKVVELITDYWIDYAYSTGSISQSESNEYKARTTNIDRQYPNGGATANALKYWTLNGENILAQADYFAGEDTIGIDTSESVKTGKRVAKTRAGMRRRNTVSTSDLPSYTIVSSLRNPTLSVPIPSINTRALWWLSERLAYETLPQRPLALEADAFMPQPAVSGFKIASVNAQAALASATIVETDLRSGSLSINSAPLPMTATAQLVPLGLNIAPGVATASAKLTTNFSTITSKDDDIVLYVMHQDPILYIREDAIK